MTAHEFCIIVFVLGDAPNKNYIKNQNSIFNILKHKK